MKLRELFEARSLPNENSNGRPIVHTAESLKNFWTWFKGSKVVDEKTRPLVMYHGTGADIAQFGYEYADKGSSAYGMGFYFTNMPNTASGYAMGDTPNVVPVYLNIKKPMISNYARLLNRAQIKRFIMASPILDDALSNFGDVEYEGKTRLINSIVDQFDDCCDSLLQQLNMLANDFYRDQNEAFMRTAIAITGFDGVKHAFESGEVFFIAWDANQIKSAVGASGYQGSDLITEKFGDDWDTIQVDGGHIQIWPNAPHAPRSASVIDFVVDADKRNQGIGDKLVKAAMHKYHDLGAQVSSLASLKVFYNNGFRNPRIPETSFHDHVEAFNDNGGSLFMAMNDDTGKSYR